MPSKAGVAAIAYDAAARLRRLYRPYVEDDVHLPLLTVALDGQRDRVPRVVLEQQVKEWALAIGLAVLRSRDHVGDLDTCLLCRSPHDEVGDAVLRPAWGDLDTKERPGSLAVRNDVRRDLHDGVNVDGKADLSPMSPLPEEAVPATLIPITSPSRLSSGPPALPGQGSASCWMRFASSYPWPVRLHVDLVPAGKRAPSSSGPP